MALCLVQVRMTRFNGIPADAVVNTWHFGKETAGGIDPAGAIGDAECAEAIDALQQFYETNPAGGTRMSAFLSSELSRAAGAVEWRAYSQDMASGDLTLVRTETSQLGAAAGASDLPGEVAVVLSYHRTLLGGNADRRRRGRIYFGPIRDNAVTNANGSPEVSSTFRTDMAASALRLAQWHTQGTNVMRWAVYSNPRDADGDPTGQHGVGPVAGGFIDNAFDTQRRRGREATARTSFGPVAA